MISRPLLDYLAFPDDRQEPSEADLSMRDRHADSLVARIADLETRLRASQQAQGLQAPVQAPHQTQSDLTLSTQIEAILKRRAASQQKQAEPRHVDDYRHADDFRHVDSRAAFNDTMRTARMVVDPPSSVPMGGEALAGDQDFQKFAEAVYLIGQAARRFIDNPAYASAPAAVTPSSGDIDALTAVLRETMSTFRSVADDLAVSVGEIRHFATRNEREPARNNEWRDTPARRNREDDEILELRDDIAGLQHRLDGLLQARRRNRC
jgi:hypothetical protein